jgi:RNA polymerase-binding transcription factor DksA
MSASPRDPIVMDSDDHLTPSDREDLRRRLEVEREALLERATGLLDDDDWARSSAAAHTHGESERAVTDAERRVNAVLEAGARDALDAVVGALDRMDDGTYGRCQDCAAPIPAERLHARPAARFCVRCQQRRDPRR